VFLSLFLWYTKYHVDNNTDGANVCLVFKVSPVCAPCPRKSSTGRFWRSRAVVRPTATLLVSAEPVSELFVVSQCFMKKRVILILRVFRCVRWFDFWMRKIFALPNSSANLSKCMGKLLWTNGIYVGAIWKPVCYHRWFERQGGCSNSW
jgi:hypothetical protein